MVDDNQELSMEDILSSIKDILTEDEAAQNGAPVQSPFAPVQPDQDTAQPSPAVEEAAAPTIAQPQISEPEEDVLDLSPAMRIENEGGINLDAELGSISSGFDEINLEPQPEGQEPSSEPLFSASGLESSADFNESADLDSDPFYETETPVSGFEAASTEEPFEIADLIPADEEPFAPQAQTEAEPEPELMPEPEPQFAEPESPAEEPYVDKLEVKSDAVDVSASIISNFAKMFTKEKEPEPAKPESKVAAFAGERVHLLGSGSKTIEDVVSDVIRQIIGDEVSENWRQGCDYDAYAREVIAAQTKQWLETNLPAVVERIVKEEIARVMEKAGS